LADGPPLIRDLADPAEPDRACRKLHARAVLIGKITQYVDTVVIFKKEILV
jgi:hypothetical protein